VERLREKLETFHRAFGPRVKGLEVLESSGPVPGEEVPASSEG
jgi:hypothetical protein